jgi:RimJ/RimL family protein N-acetyltransferase
VELRTARLRLRPFRPDDVAVFEKFARTRAYLQFLGEGHPEPPEFVANNLGIDGAWVIELDNEVVGSIFLGDELACLLDPEVHGRGIASEAARAVVDDGFERRGYDEVMARADPGNTASRRGLERLGFRPCDNDTFRLDRAAWERS